MKNFEIDLLECGWKDEKKPTLLLLIAYMCPIRKGSLCGANALLGDNKTAFETKKCLGKPVGCVSVIIIIVNSFRSHVRLTARRDVHCEGREWENFAKAKPSDSICTTADKQLN